MAGKKIVPVPGTVITAVEQFLKFGKETKDKAHNGYYSEGGWPYDVLKKFVDTWNKNHN